MLFYEEQLIKLRTCIFYSHARKDEKHCSTGRRIKALDK